MPRRGPRRELLAARIDHPDMEWIKERSETLDIPFPDVVRRVVNFAHLHMPEEEWHPPTREPVE